jgi:MFS family permease
MAIDHPRDARCPTVRQPHAGRRGAALVVLCSVQFMLVLDDTVVSVALPTMRDELGFSGPGLAWVVNAYFLAFGGLLLLFGRVADLLGRYTDPVCGAHGLDHFLDQIAQRLVKAGDLLAFCPQNWFFV